MKPSFKSVDNKLSDDDNNCNIKGSTHNPYDDQDSLGCTTPDTLGLNDSSSRQDSISNSLTGLLSLRRTPTTQNLLKSSVRSTTSTPSPLTEDTYYDITKIPTQPMPFHSPDADKPSKLIPMCSGSQCYIHTGQFGNVSVVVKSIANRSVQSVVARQEFVDEINLLSRISHPHIITLLHYYEEEITTPDQSQKQQQQQSPPI